RDLSRRWGQKNVAAGQMVRCCWGRAVEWGCAATLGYRPQSKVLNPPREGDLPDLLPILVENERLARGCDRPDPPFHLTLELPRRPARIAKRDQALLRSLVGSDVPQDFAA